MNSDKALDRYIERVRAIPKLTREEEFALAKKAQAGDEDAAHQIIEANLRYVVSVALQYRRYDIRLADLIAEGSVGLMTAIQKFDPDRGFRFVTYAGYWIRAYILETVVRSTTMVGGGAGALRSKMFFRLRRERARIAHITQDPSEQITLLAESFDVKEEKMRKMLRRLDSRDVSLDQQVFDDAGSATLVDTLVSDEDTPDNIVANDRRQRALETRVSDALNVLDVRERLIVERRLLSDDGMSLAALGRELGVSRERARQLEARAKKKLRAELSDYSQNIM